MPRRRLLLIRHAKALAAGPARADHARELAPSGLRDSEVVAARLASLGWRPDVALVSDATRTRQTWAQMAPQFDPAPPKEHLKELYLGSVDAICDAVFGVEDDLHTVALVGHNPGWQTAVHYLSGEAARMKTCYAALLEQDAERWIDAMRAGAWSLVEIVRPERP